MSVEQKHVPPSGGCKATLRRWWSATGGRAWAAAATTFWREPEHATDEDLGLKDEEKATEAVAEYWRRSFQGSDSARARAQAGFAIVSAVATIFIGGSILSRIQEQATLTKTLAIVASVLWLAAISFYLNAATAANRPGKRLGGSKNNPADRLPPPGYREWGQLLHRVTVGVQLERGSLIWRTRRANLAGIAASVLSVATLTAFVFSDPPTLKIREIQLTPPGAAAVSAFCKLGGGGVLSGSLNSLDLEKQFVSVKTTGSTDCGGMRELSLRREWISTTATPGE